MTYRLPRTIPYLTAMLAAVLMGGLFFAPNTHGPLHPSVYIVTGAFAAVILLSGILSQRYSVSVEADRLVISGVHRREYLFAHMSGLEICSGGKGTPVAVVTMKDGTRVTVGGSLRDFDGFVRTLRASAGLPAPATDTR